MTPHWLKNALAIALAGCLIVESHGTARAFAAADAGVPAQGLSVTTDPDGAAVYVDGRMAGSSPVHIPNVSEGQHRVRIVKTGYLENARVVTVSAGRHVPLAVRLTPAPESSPTALEQVISGGGGASSKKWIWIAAGGAAAAAAVVVLAGGKNAAPAPGTISVSPTGTGMINLTTYTFTSQGASDPDGDSLTFSWNFGDGTTGSGSSATHVYTRTGSFDVALSISDGKNTVSAPNAPVSVGQNLNGTWAGATEPAFGCGVSTVFSQSGTGLTGSMNFVAPCTGSVPLTSSSVSGLTHPTQVTWRTVGYTHTVSDGTPFPGTVMAFTGTTDSTGAAMSGTLSMTQAAIGTRSAAVSLRKQ